MTRWKPSKMELAMGAAAAFSVFTLGLFPVGWFVVWPLTTHHDPALTISLVNSSASPGPIRLDPADVDARLPFFSEAMRAARVHGSVTFVGESRVRAITDYVVEFSPRGYQGVVIEFEYSFFRITAVTP